VAIYRVSPSEFASRPGAGLSCLLNKTCTTPYIMHLTPNKAREEEKKRHRTRETQDGGLCILNFAGDSQGVRRRREVDAEGVVDGVGGQRCVSRRKMGSLSV
jgi:hypothetical protein